MKITPLGTFIALYFTAFLIAFVNAILFGSKWWERLIIFFAILLGECGLGFFIAYRLQVWQDHRASDKEAETILRGQ